MTRKEFAACVALLAAYWPQQTKPWTPEVIRAWEELLIDLDHELVEEAIKSLAIDGGFLPGAGDIRRRVFEVIGVDLPSAEEAWAEVLDQLRSAGSYRGPQFSHPLIARVVRSMGWYELCRSESLPFERSHFIKFWQALAERERRDALMPPSTCALLARYRMGGLVPIGESAALVAEAVGVLERFN